MKNESSTNRDQKSLPTLADAIYHLQIYLHAHVTGNSVPPHIDRRAKKLIRDYCEELDRKAQEVRVRLHIGDPWSALEAFMESGAKDGVILVETMAKRECLTEHIRHASGVDPYSRNGSLVSFEFSFRRLRLLCDRMPIGGLTFDWAFVDERSRRDVESIRSRIQQKKIDTERS